MDRVAIRQTGHGIGVCHHPQALLSPSLLGYVRSGTDEENFIFPATAVNELITKKKESLALTGLHPAFHLIGIAVAKEAGDVAARGGRFLFGHEQLENVAADHLVLVEAGVLLAEAVEALNIAALIDNHDHRVGF